MWARGGRDRTDDEAQVAALVKLGVPREDAVARVREQWDEKDRPDSGDFRVLPENWEAVCLFLALENRWVRNDWTGTRVGLAATEIEATMRMRGVPPRKRGGLLAKLEKMEAAALRAMCR